MINTRCVLTAAGSVFVGASLIGSSKVFNDPQAVRLHEFFSIMVG